MACINSIINVLEDSVLYRNQLTGNIQGLVAPPNKSRQLKIDTMISQPEGFKSQELLCWEDALSSPKTFKLQKSISNQLIYLTTK